MKRLLLAPLLIALTGCSNDITTKTDLGEKYIVKESTVTVTPYLIDWDKQVNDKKYWINTYREEFEKCKLTGLDSNCIRWIEDEEKKKANLEIAEALRGRPTNLLIIEFRPIFVDLNNQKIAKNYETVYCINPNLSTSDKEAILFTSGINVPNKFSTSAFEIAKSKVCEKYAKF